MTNNEEQLLTISNAIKNNNNNKFFKNLPTSNRNLIAYYGYNCFEKGKDQYLKELYKKNLKTYFKENFNDLEPKTQEMIIDFYGHLPSRIIDFVIRNINIDSKYLEKMRIHSKKYFDNNLKQTIIFHAKYPNLSKKLFTSNIQIDDKLKELLKQLSEKSVLEKIDQLDLNELKNNGIEHHTYSTREGIIPSGNIPRGSLDNDNIDITLFKYNREILKIDIESNIEEYDAFSDHLETIIDIYQTKIPNIKSKNIIEIIHEANLSGDILLITENAGLVIWLPPTLTTNQKEKLDILLKSLTKLSKEISIALAYAIPTNSCEFIAINDGKTISLNQTIEEINRIKVNDNCLYLNQNQSKNYIL